MLSAIFNKAFENYTYLDGLGNRSMLADPESAKMSLQQSPLKDLLAMKQREHVADMVNGAIIAAELEASGSKEKPLVGCSQSPLPLQRNANLKLCCIVHIVCILTFTHCTYGHFLLAFYYNLGHFARLYQFHGTK